MVPVAFSVPLTLPVAVLVTEMSELSSTRLVRFVRASFAEELVHDEIVTGLEATKPVLKRLLATPGYIQLNPPD